MQDVGVERPVLAEAAAPAHREIELRVGADFGAERDVRTPDRGVETRVCGDLESGLQGGIAARLRGAAPDIVRRHRGVAAPVRAKTSRRSGEQNKTATGKQRQANEAWASREYVHGSEKRVDALRHSRCGSRKRAIRGSARQRKFRVNSARRGAALSRRSARQSRRMARTRSATLCSVREGRRCPNRAFCRAGGCSYARQHDQSAEREGYCQTRL